MNRSVNRWKGERIPDVIGTAKLSQAIMLIPQHEHLVWGRLPVNSPVSVGSTVLVESAEAQAQRKGVIVGRVIATLPGDRLVPVKVINPSHKPVRLRRNFKLATVFPIMAVENLDLQSSYCPREAVSVQSLGVSNGMTVESDGHSMLSIQDRPL